MASDARGNANDEVPDLPDQVENFMDYNIDRCATMFTLGQRERVMERSRPSEALW